MYFDQVRHLLHIIYITILMKFPRIAIHDDFCHFNIPHSRRSLPSFRDKLATRAHSTALCNSRKVSNLKARRRAANSYITVFFSGPSRVHVGK